MQWEQNAQLALDPHGSSANDKKRHSQIGRHGIVCIESDFIHLFIFCK